MRFSRIIKMSLPRRLKMRFSKRLKIFFFFLIILSFASNLLDYTSIAERKFNNEKIGFTKYIKLSKQNAKSCRGPNFKYNDSIAIQYIDKKAKKLKSTFDECVLNESIIDRFSRFIIHKDLSTNETELHEIKLNAEKMKKVYNLNSMPICSIRKFEKKLNISEFYKQMIYGKLNFFYKQKNFTQRIKIPGFYFLNCLNSFKNETVFTDVFTIFPYNMSTNKRPPSFTNLTLFPTDMNFDKCESDKSKIKETSKKKMNVLMIGLDSISQFHMQRVFPLTYKFLSNSGVCFTHFNKVGENTSPNHMALLCGLTNRDHSEDEFPVENSELKTLMDFDEKFHDNFPLIWREYERLGYVTMYQRDQPNIGLFNHFAGNVL